MSKNFILCVSVLLLVFRQVYSQDACERITANDLGNSVVLSTSGLLSDILTPSGEQVEGGEVQVRIRNINIVCEAQHMMRDRYRYTSVVVSFYCLTTDGRVPECNDSSVVNTEQFEFGCLNSMWTDIVQGDTTTGRATNPNATLSTELDTDCIVCFNPGHPEVRFLTRPPDTVTHCSECANCPVGLQRCYRQGIVEVCCNYFNNGLCVEQCPDGFAPNDQFECERQCPELEAVNGSSTYMYTNQRLVGGEATLTCIKGYKEANSPAACVAGPSWDSIPACNLIECSDVDNLPNGVFTYQPNDKKLVNTTATYECNPGFYLVGISVRTCTEEKTWVPVLPTMCESCALAIRDCVLCEVDDKSDEPICTMCKEGFILDSDGKCTTSSPVAPQAGSCDVPCIIGIVLAILAVIIIGTVVAVVAFVLYKYLNDPATKLAKTDTGGLNGVARDNPLYVDPAAVTDEGLDGVATETTPLEA